MPDDIYAQLADHLSLLEMGMPHTETLVDILKANFTQTEAQAAMLLPADHTPLKPIAVDDLNIPDDWDRERLAATLKDLAGRGLIFSGKTGDGSTGYALHQTGFGFPQTFFWQGKHTAHAQKMTKLILKYFNRNVTREALGGKITKASRYIPINQSLSAQAQHILPHDRMDTVLDNATRFAVAHCPCRVQGEIIGRACGHPLEVCLKFDEMAEYIIDLGVGREITREEARDIVREAAEIGLVHFVDNAGGNVKHNCNCCGCSCWNVGSIRRRKIPRDAIMAVYFLRETIAENCIGCGECLDICPVQALEIQDDIAVVDKQWCIGCGVCVPKCDYDAIRIVYRQDKKDLPPDFDTLHQQIMSEHES